MEKVVRMIVNMQFTWFVLMIWMGWQLTAAFDVLRVTISVGQLPRWLGMIFEIVFAMLAGIYLFRQLLIINGGEIRYAFVIAAIIGGWMYWRFFRMFFRMITQTIVRIIRLVLQYCKRLLVVLFIYPLRLLLRLVRSFLALIAALLMRMFPSSLKRALTKLRNRIKILVQRLTKFD
jgi:spore cortex biosynthesis protein YabQ